MGRNLGAVENALALLALYKQHETLGVSVERPTPSSRAVSAAVPSGARTSTAVFSISGRAVISEAHRRAPRLRST